MTGAAVAGARIGVPVGAVAGVLIVALVEGIDGYLNDSMAAYDERLLDHRLHLTWVAAAYV